MTDPNEVYEAVMQELSKTTICDAEMEDTDEEETCLRHDDEVSDEIPQSILGYLEASKRRVTDCEEIIPQDLEDLTAPRCSVDILKDLPFEKDPVKLNELVICVENEESDSNDTSLIPVPIQTEMEELFTYNMSTCLNSEGEVEGDEYLKCEKRLAMELKALEVSQKEDEERRSTACQAEREKQQQEQKEKEERRRLRERDFKEELSRKEEAEKLHQIEFEMIERRAQEELQQELLQQQELNRKLHMQVEEERRAFEEAKEQARRRSEALRHGAATTIQAAARGLLARRWSRTELRRRREELRRREEQLRRTRELEERRKREWDEEMKRTAKEARERERRRMEYERAKEEERARLERECRLEEERRREEEERRREEEERKTREEEERRRREEEKKRREEEERKTRQEDERRKEEKRREEEERKTRQEDERRKEEKRREEEERKTREEEERRKEEKRREVERKTREEEGRRRQEEARRKKREEDTTKREEKREKEDKERKKDEEERRKEEGRKSREEDEEKKKGEGEGNKMEAERMKMEAEEGIRREEEPNGRSDEETRFREEDDGRRTADEDTGREEQGTRRAKEHGKNRRGTTDHGVYAADRRAHPEASQRASSTLRAAASKQNTAATDPAATQPAGDAVKRYDLNDDNGRHTSDCNPVPDVEDPAVSQSPSTCPDSVPAGLPDHTEQSPSTCPDSVPAGLPDHTEQSPSTCPDSVPAGLPDHTEQRRLSWMRDCTPWSKLALQNRRRRTGSTQGRRGARRGARGGSLPPLCPDTLLQSGGWRSLREVTTVSLKDLPGCSLSTLAQCVRLQSLTLRRCGLKALDGLGQCPELCYIDVQENDITFVDCENLANLRVLRLGHNQLTSIHGLGGAVSLDVLELSYNSITRIAGLESVKRLQRLSVDHNQLISTRGLREVYTLLRLDCSHNHLTRVEGLENCALLSTLDLRANNLTEPPSLNNQVLLTELLLDDNSISSLRSLADCWLPLMQRLSAAHNSITQLPPMSHCVSLVNLNLGHNCLSELGSTCESLEGCPVLQELHLTWNPLEQESSWRSTLRKAVPGLRVIDGQEINTSPSPPVGHDGPRPSGSFLAFCHAQLQQTHDLEQRHSRESSGASSLLHALKLSCQYYTDALRLAEEQRYAHEYGDTAVARPETPSPGNSRPHTVPPLGLTGDSGGDGTSEEKAATETLPDTQKTLTTGPETVSNANVSTFSSPSSPEKEKATSSRLRKTPRPRTPDLRNTAAAVIQQRWRRHRQRCVSISSPPAADRGGGAASGPSHLDWRILDPDHAATVIQALWRGCTLRKRLASALALAAAACPDAGEEEEEEEEEGFEEVDIDEFVFDEMELDRDWTLPLLEDPPPRARPVSDLLCPGPEPSQYKLPPPPPKQAWVAGEQVSSPGQRVSPESTSRAKSPASTSALSGLSEISDKILEEWGFRDSRTALLMLKRAQKMTSKKRRQQKLQNPSVRLALFRDRANQFGPAEARKRPASDKRDYLKVPEVEAGLRRAGKVEQVRSNQERTYQWLHTQAARSDRRSASDRFLPEINPDILNGGRVQLVAGPGYRAGPDQAVGLQASSSSVSQPRKDNSHPQRNSWRKPKEIPSPSRVTSSPSRKERMSFRDNPVQMSSGWGGGKKRSKV